MNYQNTADRHEATSATDAGEQQTLFVARQPIFDVKQRVVAYELLYRASRDNAFNGSDGSSATLSVLRDTFLILGPQLIGSSKAFINFNRDLLERRLPLILRPDVTVVEILEDVEVDHVVETACRELKQAGYTIALDDFTVSTNDRGPLLDLADIIKADFRQMTKEERRALVKKGNRKHQFLAEKVETHEEFNEAIEAGYVLFQGYFFGKPVMVSAKNIPGDKVNYLRMLSEINQRELNFDNLEKIIRQDTYLSYTLLNYMNSAYFGLRQHIASIKQALALLGEREVTKWASLVILTFIGTDKPSEVSVASLIRAHFCESLAGSVGLSERASELFMMGMFSMLDVLIGRPMEEVLNQMNVSNDIRTALTTGDNRHGHLYQLILSYEQADWTGFDRWTEQLGLDKATVASVYQASVVWAEQVLETQVKKPKN
jgi:c-di-GMP-related signal transduction protein